MSVDVLVSFHRERDGTVRRMTLHQNGDRDATRLISVKLSPTEFAKFAGAYYSEEL